MNFSDWYTDTVDVWRVIESKDGNLTRHTRTRVHEGIPCRIYQTNDKAIGMSQTAAGISQESKLACDNSADILPGDELLIHRGRRIGRKGVDIRAFAGDPDYYFEPFGAVIPQLAHQQIKLLQEERVK